MKIEIIDDPSRRGRGGYVEYEGTKINSWTKATIHLPPADTTPQKGVLEPKFSRSYY